MNILITGAAGFIGHSLVDRLSKNKKNTIIGIDNFNTYSGKDIKNLSIPGSVMVTGPPDLICS